MEIKENFDQLTKDAGKELDSTGYDDRGNRAEATVIYSSGIPNFDKIFHPHKFEETNCLLEIISFKNCIVFLLLLPNAKTISNYVIWRKDIISYNLSDLTDIVVPKFELIKALMPSGPGAGLVGAAISEVNSNKFLKKKAYKIVGTKIKRGRNLILTHKSPESNETKEIHLKIPKGTSTELFFENHWKREMSEKDLNQSKCYIATACYESPSAKEVVFLRLYRDDVLLKNWLGQFFVKTYYSVSPFVVKHFYNNRLIKRITRRFLDKLIQFLKQ